MRESPQNQINVGEVWQHRRSRARYVIVALANALADEAHKNDFPLQVVYCKCDETSLWSRPIGAFMEAMDLVSDPTSVQTNQE